jgi:hypothetical protein
MTLVCETGYFHLWGQWFSGLELRDCTLAGIKILYWGRIGKFITLLSGFVILIDVFGERRIRRLGACLYLGRRRLRRANNALRHFIIRAMASVISSPIWIISRGWQRVAYINLARFFSWLYIGGFPTNLIVYSGYALILALLFMVFVGTDPFTAKLDDFPPVAKVIFLSTAILLFFPLGIIYSLRYVSRTLAFVEIAYVNPTVWALRNPYFIVTARTLSLILLAVGMHLELLAM